MIEQHYIDDTPKYRKKRPQNSKVAKRADHKHEYAKTITMSKPRYSDLPCFFWSEHCLICGKMRNLWFSSKDFRDEKTQRRLFLKEVIEKYPGVPIYENDLWAEKRIV